MMNTQALDALAALCGAATSAAPAATPSASVANNTHISSYALLARQLQGTQAAANEQRQHQSARQHPATVAATPSTVPLDVLNAYLISAGQQGHRQASINNIPRVSLDSSAGFAAPASGLGGGGGLLAAVAGLRGTPQPQPDLHAQARAIAAKVLMAQQQQQQQQQQHHQHHQQRQQPQQMHHSPLQQPQQMQQPTLQQPQQQYSHPGILVKNQAVSHPPASATQYPQAAVSSSPYVPPITPCPQHVGEVTPTQDEKKSNPPLPQKVVIKRPPPKKRRVRSASTGQAGCLGDPALKSVISEWEDKKQAKRAANRLSAHLSRKRKKMLIEDLKDENLELRRKEQILQSIPDLIVVFDSSGRMPFVSASVTRFLDYTAEELENASFWDLLTEVSVQTIKSAFMDALAAKRSPEEDSTPLCGGGSMTVELLDKDDNYHGRGGRGRLVSLKGVVHFAGESPECVCSIRPEGCVRVGGAGRYTRRKVKNTAPSMNVSSLSEESSNQQTRMSSSDHGQWVSMDDQTPPP